MSCNAIEPIFKAFVMNSVRIFSFLSEVMSKRLVELEKKLRLLESPELRKLLKQLEDG